MSETGYDARKYWDRRLHRDWTLHGVGLLALSHSYNRWLYRVRDRVFRRAVAVTDLSDVPAPRILDVGPGVGFYIARWKQRGATVTAVDIADSAVRKLQAAHPDVSVLRLDISDDVAQLEGGYDAVSAFDVLFHIVDDDRYRRALHNVADLLRPGGWFIFTESLARRRAQSMKHYVRRTRAETEDAVRDAGLELIATRPAFVLMSTPFDSRHKRWRSMWNERVAGPARTERGGNIVGALLYLPELVLTRFLRNGPSTKLVVCRKPVAGP
jgi:SAM-dependent methyltransferase